MKLVCITHLTNVVRYIHTNVTQSTHQCLKLMVAQSPMATKNWAGPVEFHPGQVKIIINYIWRKIFSIFLGN